MKREAVFAEMASVKNELDELVNAPVSGGGRDLTLWLPDEHMEMIFLNVPFEVLCMGCERVCQRWRRIVRESSLVKRRKQDERYVGGVRGRNNQASGTRGACQCCQSFYSGAGRQDLL